MQFILGPLVVVAGILIMKYSVQITEFSGKIDFAEQYLGNGLAAGTYTWWKLVGLIVAIYGGMWFFGITDLIGNGLAGLFAIR